MQSSDNSGAIVEPRLLNKYRDALLDGIMTEEQLKHLSADSGIRLILWMHMVCSGRYTKRDDLRQRVS